MDFETKLRALESLAASKTDAAQKALRVELERSRKLLRESSSYDELDNALRVLKTVGFISSREAVESLVTFIESIESRSLTHPDELRKILVAVERYRNAETLVAHAIDSLRMLRYLEPVPLLYCLLALTNHASEQIRKKSLESLSEMAEYNITVFYGRGDSVGIGALPQLSIVSEIEKLLDDKVQQQIEGILKILAELLSPTMEGTTWSYKQVTISQAATPSHPTVEEVRDKTIGLLIRIFGIVSTSKEKIRVIGIMHEATRTGRRSREGADFEMYVRDTKRVLRFFGDVVATTDLPVLQKIEHDSYLIHHHAISNDIKQEALRLRDLIGEIHEYQIYKNLVGFEGVFSDWEKESTHSQFTEIDRSRRERAIGYAAAINEESYVEWRERILRYAKVESNDLATFPIFYFFLEEFARVNPNLAFQLLSDDTEEIARFMIPLLRGLWTGPQNGRLRILVESWITDGNYLYAVARQFIENAAIDVQFVREILDRAIELDDIDTIAQIVSVAVSNFKIDDVEVVEHLFVPALEVMTSRCVATWAFDAWILKQLKEFLSVAEPNIIDAVLRNLLWLDKVDYHAEEILSLIAERYPEKVFDYFIGRTKNEEAAMAAAHGEYEALPFELSKLHEFLSQFPAVAVEKFRKAYDGDFSALVNDGGRFLTSIFKKIQPDFESELLRLVANDDQQDIEFVLAILRNYKGEEFTHGVAKALISKLPPESKMLNEVAVALDSTGVVWGEYGFAQAYEQKIEEIRPWLDDNNERVRAFTKTYLSDLERMAAEERKRADESIELGKHRYGES
ncbi:MAG: hypothetical protein ABUL52_00850 [Solimonas sp.]